MVSQSRFDSLEHPAYPLRRSVAPLLAALLTVCASAPALGQKAGPSSAPPAQSAPPAGGATGGATATQRELPGDREAVVVPPATGTQREFVTPPPAGIDPGIHEGNRRAERQAAPLERPGAPTPPPKSKAPKQE